MPAKGKYCEDIVQTIVDIIAQTGSDKAAIEAAGISHETFYQWMKDAKKPEFKERIASAKREYRRICPDELIRKANQRIADALDENRRSKRVSVTTRVIRHFNADGVLKWYQEHEERTEHDEQLPIPPWAIDRVLPKAVHTLQQLVAVASEYGLRLEISDADLFNKYLAAYQPEGDRESASGSGGISQETAESIRRQIMGIDN